MTVRILVRELRAACIIGTMPKERLAPQAVVMELELDADADGAVHSDDLRDTVDYKALKNRILEHVSASTHRLIEALAGDVARLCLEDPRVLRAAVTVDKPGALTGARSVAVRVELARTGTSAHALAPGAARAQAGGPGSGKAKGRA